MAMNIATLDSLLERNLLQALARNRIDLDSGHMCRELRTILNQFLHSIARQYQPEIDAELNRQVPLRSEGDLISWVVKEVTLLQSIAFDLYYQEICQREALNAGEHRVNCVTAHMHSYMLTTMFEKAVELWIKGHEDAAPSSPKFVRKHALRDWAPWLVHLVFAPPPAPPTAPRRAA